MTEMADIFTKHKEELSKYIGQWVLICDDKIIAHDKKLGKVRKKLKECKRTPTLTKIPKEDTLIF